MIKVVIFDVGGVLKVETDDAIRQDVQQTLGIAQEVFNDVWNALVHRLGEGVMTEDEFWQQLYKQSHAKHPLPHESLLMREYIKGYQKNNEVIAIAEQSRKHGYKTAILSNTITCHANFNRQQGLYHGFDPVVLSHEIHLSKPSPEIFHYILNLLYVEPQEAVLIDDHEKNITGAHHVHMHAILFKTGSHLEDDLKNIGIMI